MKWGLSVLDWRSHAINEHADHPIGVFKAECGHLLMMTTPLRDEPGGAPCQWCAGHTRAATGGPPVTLPSRDLTPGQRLAAQAAEAAEVRYWQTDPDVVALRVERTRLTVDRLIWCAIVIGLCCTMTNVQQFAAGVMGADPGDLGWWAAWLIDPVVGAGLLGVLIAERRVSGICQTRWDKGGGELKPILASWLTDRAEFIEKVKDTSHRAGHTTLWHAVHSPLHLWHVVKYAPRGGWRVVSAIWGWVFDAEGKPLRRQAVNTNQTAEWLRLTKERQERIHRRWIGLAALTALALVSALLLWFWVPHARWGFTVAACAAVVALSYVGRPIDKPLLTRATDISGNQPLNPELILKALIRSFQPAMVIGLVQTFDYARAMMPGRTSGQTLQQLTQSRR
ncbi:MAG: hypothetical protein ACRDRP_23045, partial [Pseudonocardiaceae bacterium]